MNLFSLEKQLPRLLQRLLSWKQQPSQAQVEDSEKEEDLHIVEIEGNLNVLDAEGRIDREAVDSRGEW